MGIFDTFAHEFRAVTTPTTRVPTALREIGKGLGATTERIIAPRAQKIIQEGLTGEWSIDPYRRKLAIQVDPKYGKLVGEFETSIINIKKQNDEIIKVKNLLKMSDKNLFEMGTSKVELNKKMEVLKLRNKTERESMRKKRKEINTIVPGKSELEKLRAAQLAERGRGRVSVERYTKNQYNENKDLRNAFFKQLSEGTDITEKLEFKAVDETARKLLKRWGYSLGAQMDIIPGSMALRTLVYDSVANRFLEFQKGITPKELKDYYLEYLDSEQDKILTSKQSEGIKLARMMALMKEGAEVADPAAFGNKANLIIGSKILTEGMGNVGVNYNILKMKGAVAPTWTEQMANAVGASFGENKQLQEIALDAGQIAYNKLYEKNKNVLIRKAKKPHNIDTAIQKALFSTGKGGVAHLAPLDERVFQNPDLWTEENKYWMGLYLNQFGDKGTYGYMTARHPSTKATEAIEKLKTAGFPTLK